MMNKLKAILYVIGLIIIPMALYNLLAYIAGVIITLDPNPKNWLIISSQLGRGLLLFMEILFIGSVEKFWNIFEE